MILAGHLCHSVTLQTPTVNRYAYGAETVTQADLSTVWPIWIGEARDPTQLAQIAATLHADPFANPYSRA